MESLVGFKRHLGAQRIMRKILYLVATILAAANLHAIEVVDLAEAEAAILQAEQPTDDLVAEEMEFKAGMEGEEMPMEVAEMEEKPKLEVANGEKAVGAEEQKDVMSEEIVMKVDMEGVDEAVEEAVEVAEVGEKPDIEVIEVIEEGLPAAVEVAPPLPVNTDIRLVQPAPVTTRRTTVRTTTRAPPAPESNPSLLQRLGSSIGNNIVTGGALLFSAASPLWGALLVGKKRRRRSDKANEIPDHKPIEHYAKMISNYIKNHHHLVQEKLKKSQ